jgi:DNA-binding SARP family transcriptional activator
LSIERLVSDRYDVLSHGEKTIARYLVAHAEEASSLSARQIAARAGSSASTVVRLARSLGFDGLPAMQKALLIGAREDGDTRVAVVEAPRRATDRQRSDVEIGLCGGLSIRVDGESREHLLGGNQVRLLLAYLALHRGGSVGRDQLIEALWSERSYPRQPARLLNVILSRLRRALGPEVIQSLGGRALQLAPSARVDVDEAERAIESALEAQRDGRWHEVSPGAERTLTLANAGLLPGLEAPWLEPERRRLEELGLRARELVVTAGLALGGADLAAGERAARELVARDPYRESGVLLLMRVCAAQGNVAEALDVYNALRRRLGEELGLLPSPEVRSEADLLLRGERPGSASAPLAGASRAEQGALAPVAGPRTRSAPFVGRERELAELRDLFDHATHGHAHFALLRGEAGIGKTRLATEFMAECEAGGALALYGHCDDTRLLPYQPFVDALRQYLARTSPDQRPEWTNQQRTALGRVLPELAPAAQSPADAPDTEAYWLLDAVSRLLTDIASKQPLLLVLDDLQWADRPTLLMLRHTLRAIERLPVLVLGIYRETEPGDILSDALVSLGREHPVSMLTLTGLSEAEVAELLSAYGHPEPPIRTVRTFHARTSGNPFFLEELVKAGAGDMDLTLPDTVRAVIDRRLARLSADTNRLLTIAAVVGGEVALPVVEEISTLPEEQLDEAVHEAVVAGVIVEDPDAPGTYRFAHALVRESLYRRLTTTRRGRLHLRVAEALETVAGDDDAAIAWHLAHAGPLPPAWRDKAVGHAVRAADRAEGAGEYQHAIRLYRFALDQLGAGAERDPTRRRVLHDLVSVALRLTTESAQHPDEHDAEALQAALDAIPDDEPELRARLTRRSPS